MQKEKGLVSIIIPVYNTGVILEETINSVLNQDYQHFELLLIDDGSTDDTLQKVNIPNDNRIIITRQQNQGMTRTRNNGLNQSKGEFIFFLDHDDIIESEFISERVAFLNKHLDIGFVGGPITTFPENPKNYMSAADDAETQILFFDIRYLTTPSSYLIRDSVLKENNIRMNENLSSTADRFMLIQLAKVTKGATVNKGRLLYRISENGFSQIIKPSLIYDNEKFYYELKRNNLLPKKNTSKFKSIYFWGLSIGFAKVNIKRKFLFYFFKSFFSNPMILAQKILNSVIISINI